MGQKRLDTEQSWKRWDKSLQLLIADAAEKPPPVQHYLGKSRLNSTALEQGWALQLYNMLCWSLVNPSCDCGFEPQTAEHLMSLFNPPTQRWQSEGPWASAAGGRGPPWIFIHSTDIVDRGLIVLFFVIFPIFRSFFPLAPL